MSRFTSLKYPKVFTQRSKATVL